VFVDSHRRWYDKDGQQHASGAFLWVVLPDKPAWDDPNYSIDPIDGWVSPIFHPPFKEARAFVRHVKMHQCGHFMMGSIQVGSHKQTISGTYGDDGLPDTVARHVWEVGVPVPEDIMETWAHSTSGHNGAGDEARAIYSWARENIKALRRAGRDL